MSETIDASRYLRSLEGRDIFTVTRRLPNRVLRVEDRHVLVATGKSPRGQAVPIEEVQSALDRLARGEVVRVNVPSLGYRSAFVGAVMASLPGAHVLREPTRIVLPSPR